MKLDYKESFSGGVTFDCVAVNRATDFDPYIQPSPVSDDNHNSIALIIAFDDFDYFTAGDLTFKSEKSLIKGIKNVDVYHVNHHGSSATSSDLGFLKKLDPEVSVASNGTRHGHPTATVAIRLIKEIKSKFYQTNTNKDERAHQPDPKYVADDTFYKDKKKENAEGAIGTIRIVVDPLTDKYYVIMPGLPLSKAAFNIEK